MTDLSNKPISYTGSHPLELAYRALLARAEAAEALAYERLEDMLFAEQRATDADLRAEAAEAEAARLAARVAELESQLAAQGWRPVTEEPDADAMYPVRVQYRGQVYLDREMRNWNRASGWNDMFAQSKVVEWYPLPPAPQEPE